MTSLSSFLGFAVYGGQGVLLGPLIVCLATLLYGSLAWFLRKFCGEEENLPDSGGGSGVSCDADPDLAHRANSGATWILAVASHGETVVNCYLCVPHIVARPMSARTANLLTGWFGVCDCQMPGWTAAVKAALHQGTLNTLSACLIIRCSLNRAFCSCLPRPTHHRLLRPDTNANSDGGVGTTVRGRLLSGSATSVDVQRCRRTVTLRLVRAGKLIAGEVELRPLSKACLADTSMNSKILHGSWNA